jgi:hypothetical protein
MSLIAGPIFEQVLGENNSTVSIIVKTTALSGMTTIFESIGGNFNNQNYTIEVSDDKINWILIRNVDLGQLNVITNSFSIDNQSVFSNPLHFRYVRFSVIGLGSGIKCRVTVGGR